MNIIIKQIELMQRIDRLIRMKATGPPILLAHRLGISRTKLYRMIRIMKDLNAPVEYDETIQSYVYEEEVGLIFGFYTNELRISKIQAIT